MIGKLFIKIKLMGINNEIKGFIIKEVIEKIKEASGLGSVSGAKRKKGYVSPKTTKAKSTKTQAKSTLDTHTAKEPTRYEVQNLGLIHILNQQQHLKRDRHNQHLDGWILLL